MHISNMIFIKRVFCQLFFCSFSLGHSFWCGDWNRSDCLTFQLLGRTLIAFRMLYVLLLTFFVLPSLYFVLARGLVSHWYVRRKRDHLFCYRFRCSIYDTNYKRELGLTRLCSSSTKSTCCSRAIAS